MVASVMKHDDTVLWIELVQIFRHVLSVPSIAAEAEDQGLGSIGAVRRKIDALQPLSMRCLHRQAFGGWR